MKVKVLFFASLKELAERNYEELDFNEEVITARVVLDRLKVCFNS